MAANMITEEIKKNLLKFLQKNKKVDLVTIFFLFLEKKYDLKPVLFPKEKKIYQSLDHLIEKLEKNQLTKEDIQSYGKNLQQIDRANLFLQDVEARFRNMYSEAYKYSEEDARKKLREIGKKWAEENERQKKRWIYCIKK